jgi:transporter family protein
MVLAVSTTIVSIVALAIAIVRGELKPLIFDLEKGTLAWAIAGGIALTVAVSSLFHALSLGPANVVVPIYGMFIIGGSLLGVLFLGEPMTWNKIVKQVAPGIGVVLISIWGSLVMCPPRQWWALRFAPYGSFHPPCRPKRSVGAPQVDGRIGLSGSGIAGEVPSGRATAA